MLHAEPEARKVLCTVREEIEKIPLRHQRDELAMGGQMPEIGCLEPKIPHHAADGSKLLVGNL